MPEKELIKSKLVFIYNSDSGVFNTLADIGHKIFSPQTYPCHLCELTHGYFSMQREWRRFMDAQDIPLIFIHRDQFFKNYPELEHTLLPVILIETPHFASIFLDNIALESCHNTSQLINLIDETLQQHNL